MDGDSHTTRRSVEEYYLRGRVAEGEQEESIANQSALAVYA
jgi:hypothetical protein